MCISEAASVVRHRVGLIQKVFLVVLKRELYAGHTYFLYCLYIFKIKVTHPSFIDVYSDNYPKCFYFGVVDQL